MYDTAYLVNWLRDKAARAGDHSFQRMLSAAAQRLEELSRAQQWTSVSDGLPSTAHYVYDDVDGPVEWDASEDVLGVTLAGDLVVARYVQEDGTDYWYDPNEGTPLQIDRWRPDPRKSVEV